MSIDILVLGNQLPVQFLFLGTAVKEKFKEYKGSG
jgi:hypothetical protein